MSDPRPLCPRCESRNTQPGDLRRCHDCGLTWKKRSKGINRNPRTKNKPSALTRTQRIERVPDPSRYDQDYPLVIFDAVEKVGALGPHPKAPRDLPGVYYVASILESS